MKQRLLIIISAILFLSYNVAFAGSVKCECPTISAKGTGNSDCSASESGGTCTVDFNTFDDADEKKAIDLIARIIQDGINFSKIPNGLDPLTASRLNAQGEYALVDQLAIYTMVSVVQNNNAIINDSGLRNVFNTMRNQARDISNAFIKRNQYFQQNGVLVTTGCIEIQDGRNLWAMYKTKSSPSAQSPRCRPLQ